MRAITQDEYGATLKELIESGQLTPVLDRTFPLADAAKAIGYVQTGRAWGQVVIAIKPTGPPG